MKRSIFLFTVLMFCLHTAFAQTPISASESRGYLIGPGDKITGKVMGEEDYNFEKTVDENGNIQVPFYDKPVSVMCKSENEVKDEITKLLQKYLRDPHADVSVIERKSRPPVSISGEVKTQGPVILTRKTRLFELISFSGGVTEDAGGTIQIFRTQAPMCADETEKENWKNATASGLDVPSEMYSLSSLRQGKDDANPVIYPGDIVVVQKANPVYLIGEIKGGQGGVLIKEGGLSLTRAIAMVGGVGREAKTKDIKIYRQKQNSVEREIISANYELIKKGTQKDIMLEPYDIVEVDKAKKSIAQSVLDIAIGSARTMATGIPTGLTQRILY